MAGALLPGIGPLEDVLTIIGLLYAGKVIISVVWGTITGLRAHVWSRLWKKNLVEKYGGKWAVVTGSTDGIGKEYAKQLAKEGMNIILLSRTMDKLQKVAAEIAEESGVQTEVVQIDFSYGRRIYEIVGSHLGDKEIGILVNNVGVMLPYPMDFAYVNDKDIWGHVNVNVATIPAMTKLVLPQMMTRGKGAIINIASIAGSGPIPLMGIYAATKAFVDYFSQALEWECRGTGITVQTVNPGYVSTNMTSMSELIHRPSLLIPVAKTFVSHALSTLGYASRTCGYWIHGLQAHFLENFVTTWMFKYSMYLFNSLIIKSMKKNQEDDDSDQS
ncbi:Inactive hydroxysteroid dehydrogenase-like protein 1 [Halocaridina rubra]|uniref:Inactive hydroxysteroid dehydrogenase-like protein 1 n=1 Tax=Halocaridina rubra TaxID=373956 RepID=A0AAN9AG42_HALRR